MFGQHSHNYVCLHAPFVVALQLPGSRHGRTEHGPPQTIQSELSQCSLLRRQDLHEKRQLATNTVRRYSIHLNDVDTVSQIITYCLRKLVLLTTVLSDEWISQCTNNFGRRPPGKPQTGRPGRNWKDNIKSLNRLCESGVSGTGSGSRVSTGVLEPSNLLS